MKESTDDRSSILANSFDAPKLHPVPHLRLRRVRGQLTYVPEDRIEPPHVVVLRGGMVLPPVDGCAWSARASTSTTTIPLPREESHAGNLERLDESFRSKRIFRPWKAASPSARWRRTGCRWSGRSAENVYGAFAYGSRGLVWAALAAELLASELEGEPLPLEGKLADAIAPVRFARRSDRAGRGGMILDAARCVRAALAAGGDRAASATAAAQQKTSAAAARRAARW